MEELQNSKWHGAFIHPLPTQEAAPVRGLAKVGELGHRDVPHLWHPSRKKRSKAEAASALALAHPSQIRTLDKALENSAPSWPCLDFQVPSIRQPASS